ncbi:survival of motor neuron-related-splicing factor 30-like [Paramacrobiotus metropolitanus]|uniref:survival of motor neuron-related-splicing factor 30-like n=1 Tax=Paramacrobiotus metropolitanus TaxID=2943436 RepID=UPI002445910C|nr:survival of motor neuron-related-splicing factor 30-like [Paramacrobiotus metropolitanus]
MAGAEQDLPTTLSSYKLQLRQVEAALTQQPDNPEFLALQQNLREVIDLTLELIAQVRTNAPANADDSKETLSDWNEGDACVALWSEDGEFYDAVIKQISDDGHCVVEFRDLNTTDNTPISTLQKPGAVQTKKPSRPTEFQYEDVPSTSVAMEQRLASKNKRDQLKAQIEAKKKKRQKYNDKMKEIEEVREKEASKWKNFQTKTTRKQYAGVTKKSIFATSEQAQGRVGVGTCGISGKPMTKDAAPAIGKTLVTKKSTLYNPRTN